MNAILIVLPILTILMFDLGLGCRIENFVEVARKPKPIIVGEIGQILMMPLIAAVLGIVFHLNAIFFIGLMLIACSPGGSSSNIFSMLAKGNVALSVTLTALSSLITLITIPIIMNCTIGFVDKTMTLSIHLPVGKLILQNIILMFVPFFVGVVYAHFFKKSTVKISKLLGKIAFPLLMLLAAIFFIQHWQTILSNLTTLGTCIVCFILLAMLCAALLCRITRLQSRDRRTIIIEVGMQNAAQAIAVASSPFIFHNDIIGIPAILYALFMNVILLTYVAVVKRKVKA